MPFLIAGAATFGALLLAWALCRVSGEGLPTEADQGQCWTCGAPSADLLCVRCRDVAA